MNVILELTEDDLKKLYAESKISVKTELIYKKNKLDDLDLFLKVIKKDREKINLILKKYYFIIKLIKCYNIFKKWKENKILNISVFVYFLFYLY